MHACYLQWHLYIIIGVIVVPGVLCEYHDSPCTQHVCIFLIIAPSAAPIDFSCEVGSGPEVLYTWGPPPMDKINGIIRNYTITYNPFNITEEAIELVVPENVTSLTVTNLTSSTLYTTTIQANTVTSGPPASITCLTGNYKVRGYYTEGTLCHGDLGLFKFPYRTWC